MSEQSTDTDIQSQPRETSAGAEPEETTGAARPVRASSIGLALLPSDRQEDAETQKAYKDSTGVTTGQDTQPGGHSATRNFSLPFSGGCETAGRLVVRHPWIVASTGPQKVTTDDEPGASRASSTNTQFEEDAPLIADRGHPSGSKRESFGWLSVPEVSGGGGAGADSSHYNVIPTTIKGEQSSFLTQSREEDSSDLSGTSSDDSDGNGAVRKRRSRQPRGSLRFSTGEAESALPGITPKTLRIQGQDMSSDPGSN